MIYRFILVLLLFLPMTAMADHHEVHSDQTQHKACPYCGMDRVKFAHSRMLITYESGPSVGLCSLRCLVVEYVNALDRQPKQIFVADKTSQKLIDAKTAFWVLVPGTPGVMTHRAKWAFADRASAQAYIEQNGGEQVDFDTAMVAALSDLYADTQASRAKRQAGKMKHPHARGPK